MDTDIEKQEGEIDVKIVSKEEADWTNVKETAIKTIDRAKMDILIHQRVIDLCEEQLKQLQKSS